MDLSWVRGDRQGLRMFLDCETSSKVEPFTEKENTGKGADLWDNKSLVLNMVRMWFL